jgi:hypothetical protein
LADHLSTERPCDHQKENFSYVSYS